MAKKVAKVEVPEKLERVSLNTLVDEVHAIDPSNRSKKEIKDIVKMTMQVMADLLVEKKILAIPDLFILTPAFRPARTAYNPQDPNKPIELPDRWTLRVKMSSSLKERINR